MRNARLALLLATAATAVASTSATAATIGVSPAGSISTSAAPLDITTTSGPNINCSASFRGSINSRIADTSGSAVGSLDSASLSSCTPGFGFALLITPVIDVWPITVVRVLGTPPALYGVLVNKQAQLSFTVLGLTCLYRGPVGFLANFFGLINGDIGIGPFTRLGSGSSIPLISGGGACPSTANVNTQLTFFPLQRVVII